MDQTVLIAILSPILVTVGGIFSWILKSKKEEELTAELNSREYKIEIYKKLLEPFIATLTTTIPQKVREREIAKVTSLEYKRAVFDLTTFGSDKSIQIFNKIMQTFFNSSFYKDEEGDYNREYGDRLIALLSELLLQIRKDLYKERAKLKRSEMLEFMITDMKLTEQSINEMKL